VEQLLADCFLAPISDTGPGLLVPEFNIVRTPEVLIFYSPPTTPQASQTTSIVEPIASESEEDQTLDSAASQPAADCSPSSEVPPADQLQVRKRKDREEKARRIHRRLQRRRRRRRASDVPFLGIPIKPYLELMQATAERLSSDKSLQAVEDCEPPPAETTTGTPQTWELLRWFRIDPARWCALIEHFGDLFCWAVGTPEHMAERAHTRGKKWLHGSKPCRDEFT